MTIPITRTFTLESSGNAIEILSERYNEPQWMRSARRAAWQQYQMLPWPSRKEEAWRRLPLEQYPLDLRELTLFAAPPALPQNLPPCWLSPLTPETQASGVLMHGNAVVAQELIDPKLAAQGVVLSDLHAALHTHGELIQRLWMQGPNTRPDFNKFTALHGALWHGGTFVYVPDGVKISLPMQIMVGYDEEGGPGMHHTFVYVGKGARVTLLHDRHSQERTPQLNTEVVEIYAEEGAWVRYASLQHWGEQRYTVSAQNVHLAQNAHLVWLNAGLGGQITKDFLRTDLAGSGAHAVMQGFAFASGQQQIDQSTYQRHAAPDTFSDLLFRNVLRDQARTVFYGMIRVEPEAHNTQGYQANNNLLLDNARAHAIPGLEILANDVSCSHGATVSRIDEEQRFYLQARAIPPEEADQLVVQGFLSPIIDSIPLACTRDQLREEIGWRFRK